MATRKELERRLTRLQSGLRRRKLDAMIVIDRFNAFYMTGFQSSLSFLLVTPKHARLLVDGRYIEAARSSVEHCEVELFKTLSDGFKRWDRAFHPRRIGLEGSVPWNDWKQMKDFLPGADFVEAGGLILDQRLIKSREEIAQLEASAKMNDEIYAAAVGASRVGATELDIRNFIRAETDRRGAEGTSFEPIVAAGKSGSMPHYHAGRNRLRAGDLLLIDMGILLGGYCSDMTRVVALGDGVKPRLRKAFDAVLEAEKAAMAEAGPGVKTADLHRLAQQKLKRRGFDRYFTHGLGHGVGLEIHEAPRLNSVSKEILKPGMIVTIEPGVYLPGVGGIRIEDMVVITKNGCRSLSRAAKGYRAIPFSP